MAVRLNVGVPSPGGQRAPADSAVAPQQSARCGRWEIVMSTDTAKLINSELLPDNVYSDEEELLTESDLKQLKERLEGIARVGTLLSAPEIRFSIIDPAMLRYNRIEALSLGTRASVDFGTYVLSAQARIGIADLAPNFELAVQRPGRDMTLTLGGYRRLNSTDPWRRPFTIGNSLSAVLLGNDDTDFYRTLGVELRGEPAGAGGGSYSWRLYAQQERSAEVETQFSIRHLLNEDHTFRANVLADRNDAVGGEGTLRFQRGLNPSGFKFVAELYGNASAGTMNFGRGALTLRFGIPLPGPFDMATEYAAGTSVDSVPLQHNWYLGGSNTLRGYRGGQMIGESFWRARAEIGFGIPGIRLVAFGDAGWAGPRADFSKGRPLLSAGIGQSLIDGFIRLDVARALRAPTGWAVILHLDAAL
jgi:hypothetical protein